MSMMHYAGLDFHASGSSLCVRDGNGKTILNKSIPGRWEKVLQTVAQLPRPLSICYEASCGYGFLHQQLLPLADRVTVAHPGKLRLIFAAKRKNDRVDAGKLATLLQLDAVPAVHVPGIDVRCWRRLIEFRQSLVAGRTAIKNQLRALLRTHGLHRPRTLWSKSGLAWLDTVELPGLDGLQRGMLLEQLSSQSARIKRVERELEKISAEHPAMVLLRSIPGIGPRTAEAFVAYVDDARRFARSTRIGAYLGLVPCQDASAKVNRLGHITGEGPPTLRKLLCEAAWQAARRSPTVAGWLERISKGDPNRRKIAIVAVARKLAVVMLTLMRNGQRWQERIAPIEIEPKEAAKELALNSQGEKSTTKIGEDRRRSKKMKNVDEVE